MGKDKRRPWGELVEMLKEVSVPSADAVEVFRSHVGHSYERPDKKMLVSIDAIDNQTRQVFVTCTQVLERPVEFVRLNFVRGEDV